MMIKMISQKLKLMIMIVIFFTTVNMVSTDYENKNDHYDYFYNK